MTHTKIYCGANVQGTTIKMHCHGIWCFLNIYALYNSVTYMWYHTTWRSVCVYIPQSKKKGKKRLLTGSLFQSRPNSKDS